MIHSDAGGPKQRVDAVFNQPAMMHAAGQPSAVLCLYHHLRQAHACPQCWAHIGFAQQVRALHVLSYFRRLGWTESQLEEGLERGMTGNTLI